MRKGWQLREHEKGMMLQWSIFLIWAIFEKYVVLINLLFEMFLSTASLFLLYLFPVMSKLHLLFYLLCIITSDRILKIFLIFRIRDILNSHFTCSTQNALISVTFKKNQKIKAEVFYFDFIDIWKKLNIRLSLHSSNMITTWRLVTHAFINLINIME